MSKDLKDKMIQGFKKALELNKKADNLNYYGDQQISVEVSFNDNDETFSLEMDEELIESDQVVNKTTTNYSLSFGDVKVELTKKEHEKLMDKFKEAYKVFEDKKEKKLIEKLDELINA